MRSGERTCATLALFVLTACGQSGSSTESAKDSSNSATSDAEHARAAEPERADSLDTSSGESTDEDSAAFAEALGLAGRGGGRPIPQQLKPGGDCPEVPAGAEAEIAAQGEARVPLKVGLTLTEMWIPNPKEEFECLYQVKAIGRDSVDVTMECNNPRAPKSVDRRICRADLESADLLMTQSGLLTIVDSSGQPVPETMAGATGFSLSREQFADLKRTGSIQHHYVQLNPRANAVEWEAIGVLRSEGVETASVAVNDGLIKIPVIRASGDASIWRFGHSETGRVTALIVDDERFPLLIEYTHSTPSSDQPIFKLSFAKISYPDTSRAVRTQEADGSGEVPAGGEMERRLAEEKRVDVYGIYFDFNSDRIRRQSEPILAEIADVLSRNPDWTLSIGGHTDNVGGDVYNLDLSRRRSEAVRKALVDRYGIAATRLTFDGYGASAPKDTNETPEGRARNRRVELVRR